MAKKGTIDDVVAKGAHEVIKYIQGHIGEPLDERMRVFEEYNDPEKQIDEMFASEAERVVRGDPVGKTDEDKTGAYHAGMVKIEDVFKSKKASDKLTKDEALSIMEQYVDKSLRGIFPDFDKRVKKAKEAGLTDEEIRNFKGNLFSLHHIDQNGRGFNPLSEDYIRNFRGKNKLKAINRMRNLAESTQVMYLRNLTHRVTDGLFKEDEIMEIADHIKPILDKEKLKHPDHPYTKDMHTLLLDYATHIRSGDMQERGYERKREPART